MTDRGWVSEAWDRNEPARTRLPRIEELPVTEDGYDRDAVREAFDAFYRHAAQLDATLQLLESAEVFGRQATELRADLRALRAASWAPLAHRPTWTPTYRTPAAARAGSGVPEALPRLAVEVAFIILVAVGAALAELSTVLIVLLVLASWLLVGIAEFVASSRRATMRPGLLPPPRRSIDADGAGPAAVADQPPEELELEPGRVEETMIERSEVEEAEVPVAETDEAPETEGLVEEVSDPEPEPVPTAESEPVPTAEPDPSAAVAATPVEVAAQPRRRRFWRRRASQTETEPVAQAKHVRVLPPEEVEGQADAAELRGSEPLSPLDSWEQQPELPVAEEPPREEAAGDEPEAMAERAVDAGAVPAAGEDDVALVAEDGLQSVAEDESEPNADRKPEQGAEPELEPFFEADARPEWGAEGTPFAEAEPESIVEAVHDPEPEQESDPIAEIEPEPVLEVEPEAEPERERESEPLAEIEPQPEPVAELALDSAWPRESELVAETEPEPEWLPVPEPMAEAQPEPEWEREPDEPIAEAGPESPSEPSELEAEVAPSSPRRDELNDDAWAHFEQEPEPARASAGEQDAPESQPVGEAAPFEAEPATDDRERETAPSEPIPETAPFESEPDDDAVAPPSARRWPWRRGRRAQVHAAAEAELMPEPERSHVELIEIDQPIDPSMVDVPWEDDSPFGADPKPADTWSQPARFTGVEPDQFRPLGRDPDGPDDADEANGGEPERERSGRLPLTEPGDARDRSQIRSRRGRR